MSKEAACPDMEIEAITRHLRDDEATALAHLGALIIEYPGDARLHFLSGSLLASSGEIEEGHRAIALAVELAPEYHVARFQLGLLELSSGNAAAAEQTWTPLRGLPDDNFLRLFAEGLGHLIRDEFDQCRGLLTRGIELNDSLAEMNGDMLLVLQNLPDPGSAGEAAETSETQMLLGTFKASQTRH